MCRFGVGAAVMLCVGTCVTSLLPYNLAVVLKEDERPAPACSLYFSLFFGSCNGNFVLYKREFI